MSAAAGQKNRQSNRERNSGLCYRRVGHRADQFRRARWPALRPQTFEVSYERRLWPEQRPVKSRKKLMNVEHRTSNIEHRIMCSARFKKDFAKRFHHSSFVNLHSSFLVVSYELRGKRAESRVQRAACSKGLKLSCNGRSN
jgi:hypothetical protein